MAYPFPVWTGVMLLGFGVSGLFELPPEPRKATLLRAGVTLTTAFVLIRALDGYGDANHWQLQAGGATATAIDFLNTSKYPPSLEFLLMTLGPAAILCAFADHVPSAIRDRLVIFGRVPFAFYVAHFILIHALSVMLGVAQGFGWRQMKTIFLFYPKGYGVTLPGVYAVWLLVILLLYPYCRWMAGIKARRRDWWLSYV
jgi:uncharacterized membrane protein